jgi:HK97 family phage prohead protease
MERKRLLAPVEWKATSADPGMLEGHVSVFGNVDLEGDVVVPGAFKKTLADWARSKQRIPLLVDHKMSTDGVIGSLDSAEEDAVGLSVSARFSSIQKAQDIRTLLREQHINGLSFTYEPIRARPGMKGGERVRFLEELRLFEATVTPFPMNVLATPSLVKAAAAVIADEPGVILDYEAFAEAMSKALGLPTAAAKAAVDILLTAYHPTRDEKAAGPADEPKPTADAAAATGDKAPAGDTAPPTPADAERDELRHRIDDGSAYALRIISPGPRDGAPGGTPPVARAGPLATLEYAKASNELDQLEAELKAQKGTATA